MFTMHLLPAQSNSMNHVNHVNHANQVNQVNHARLVVAGERVCLHSSNITRDHTAGLGKMQIARRSCGYALILSLTLLTFLVPPGCGQRPREAQAPLAPTATPTAQPATNIITPVAPAAPPALTSSPLDPPVQWVTLAPGLRVHRALGAIEIDGEVPIDTRDPARTRIYLEWLVCTPDTREHEVLVVTRVKPSLIHAAALALGWQPGKPGAWDWKGEQIRAIEPTGERLSAYIRTPDAPSPGVPIEEWITDANTGLTLRKTQPTTGFVFAGSHLITVGGEQVYQADREGGVVGLTCFSNETIAYAAMFNPDSGVQEPVWIANTALVPPQGTAVIVTLRRALP